MLNKAMHKARLTQNTKVKHTSNAKTKTRRRERERKRERERERESERITWSFFPSTPWKNLFI